MECNKDEALRAAQIAESKMQRGDFEGGLKFAMKAKKVYAELQNTAQILTVCQVHIAAQNKLSGGSDLDWYAILQTGQLADEATIKKQYRKLALLLQPDKNKFAGAEAAFKLIGEANSVLGDQAKRSLYDMKYKISIRPAAPKTSSYHSNGNAFGAKHDDNATNYQNNSVPSSTFRNAPQQAEPQIFPKTSSHHSNGNAFGAKHDENATNHQNNSFPSSTFWNAPQQAEPLMFPKTSSHHSNGNAFGAKHDENETNYQNNSFSSSTFWNARQQAEQQIFRTSCKRCNAALHCPKCLNSFTGHDNVPPIHTWASFSNRKEAPKHSAPKPASGSNGREHADNFVPVSTKKCAAAGVGGHCKGKNRNDGFVATGRAKDNVPASKGTKATESRTSSNVGRE